MCNLKITIMKNLHLLFVLLLCNYAFAQTNVIQDGDGETSLQASGNIITINTSDASIGFMLSPFEITNQSKNIWNITGSLKSKEGTSKVFSKGKLNFQGKLGFQFVTVSDTTNDNIRHWFLGAEALYSRLNVFDSLKDFESQIDVENNLGFRVNGGWNSLFSEKAYSFGIALSGGIKDNSDEFDPNNIITTSNSFVEGNQVRTVSTTESAYDIYQLEKNNLFGKINMDIGRYLGSNNRLFANLHINYSFQENVKPKLNPAVGLFYTEKGAPLEAVVGIQLQNEDWSNTSNSDSSRWERTSIVITAGFPFN